MIKTPEALRRSIDPLLSLKLTQLVVMLGDTAYAMGDSDGQQKPNERCRYCPRRLLERPEL